MKKLLDRFPVIAVVLLLAVTLAPMMATRDYSPSNELRYVSIVDEAFTEGNVFAFTNQGQDYADKPPFYFWLMMLCKLIFGEHNMYALTLLSFIPACVIIAVMDKWLRKTYTGGPGGSKRRATAPMLATSGIFFGMTVFLRMDMLMIMWIVLALWTFWKMDTYGKKPVDKFLLPSYWTAKYNTPEELKAKYDAVRAKYGDRFLFIAAVPTLSSPANDACLATLKGTTETARKFNAAAEKAGIAKRMEDTGISGRTTKALGRACGACKQTSLARACAWSARSGGIWGGAISGGISAVSNIAAVCNGEKDGWEAAGAIAKDTAGGAISGAGAAAAATATGGLVAAGIAGTAIAGTAIGTACVVAAPVAVAIGVGCAISAAWKAIFD